MKYKNNPANIRSGSRWLGLSGTRNGFCEFQSLEYGLRALLIILYKYYYKYNLRSISSIIHRFAPPSENDTTSYILYVEKFVKNEMSFDDRYPFLIYVAVAICYYESHTSIDIKYLSQVCYKYFKRFSTYYEKENSD